MNRCSHAQPKSAELAVVVGRIQLVGQPEQILVKQKAALQPSGEHPSNRRFASSAGTGQREQRQPGKPLPVIASCTDQFRLLGGDDDLVGPVSAGGTYARVHGRSM